jgi:hypothetical protein
MLKALNTTRPWSTFASKGSFDLSDPPQSALIRGKVLHF